VPCISGLKRLTVEMLSGVARNYFRGGAKFRGPSGVQGEAPVEVWGQSPQKLSDDLTIKYVQLYLAY